MRRKFDEEFLMRAKRYLSYPVRTIDQVADKLGCDRATLSKNFKRETGITPSEYRSSKVNGSSSFKVVRIQRLLRQTDFPIKEIMHRVGYCNRRSLDRIFRLHVGTTPKEYRDRFRAQPIPNVVLEAQKLLIETDKTLTHISASLGYADHTTLDYLFNYYLGESCMDFRYRHWGSQYFPETVAKARKLLVETDLTTEQISGRLGYQSSRGLRHMIGETEGMPPTQYRIQERERLAEERRQHDVTLG